MAGAFDFTGNETEDDEDDYAPSKRGSGGGRASSKSRVVYCIIALLFGTLGIHNFYIGRTLPGVAQLSINLMLGVVSAIVAFSTMGIGLACFAYTFLIWLWAIVDIVTVTKDGGGRKLS